LLLQPSATGGRVHVKTQRLPGARRANAGLFHYAETLNTVTTRVRAENAISCAEGNTIFPRNRVIASYLAKRRATTRAVASWQRGKLHLMFRVFSHATRALSSHATNRGPILTGLGKYPLAIQA